MLRLGFSAHGYLQKNKQKKTNTKLTSSPMEKLSPTKAIPGAKNVGDCWSRQKTNKETLDFILE